MPPARTPHATPVRWEGVGHEQPPELIPELTQLVVRHVQAAAGRPG